MNVVLVEPQIPQNTGSIARSCAATKVKLHIVGNTPFEISQKTVRRAGLDYWPWVDLTLHSCWESFKKEETILTEKIWCFTKFGKVAHWDAKFKRDDYLIFGSETKGLGAEFLEQIPPERQIFIPIFEPNVRSLNLSNAVSIGLYEALRKSFLK